MRTSVEAQDVNRTSGVGSGWVEVRDVDRLPPFLVSVVSASDHWLYASSAGGLAAGRVDAQGSLFPYLTDDRLHRAHHDIGPWTCITVGGTTWEPFRPRNTGAVRRHLRKSVAGDQLVFEEEHPGLGLRFRYRWAFSERYGFVRTATLERTGGEGTLEIALVDGLQGLLPANAILPLVQTGSCLLDAYTRAEWDAEGAIALLTLEALPSDRAEPAESLRANVAWCVGLEVAAVLLCRDQLDDVARGARPAHEALVTGRPAAFLVSSNLSLAAGAAHTWHIVADVGRGHAEVAQLRRRSVDAAALGAELAAMTAALDGILCDVDGLQRTGQPDRDAHQRANALFNAMRGGVPVDEHRVSIDRFAAFVAVRNRPCRERLAAWFAAHAGATLERAALLDAALATGDADLVRLAHEVLPLWFGRRHGDPSRPWNTFSIRVRDADGGRRVSWEGNWRDVFQNWEALFASYPEFLESAVCTFVNASTRDGYNPYRITSQGVDWELPDPHDPWSNLGYWGDHQISYLTRLLELSLRHHPGRLAGLLPRERFSFADVPYRLRPYAELVQDPRAAIAFDAAAQRAVDARVAWMGQDGRLVVEGSDVLHVSLTEKLLVPVLAKLGSLVPGAGVWMNTQRPEWNDANNALAGFGVSVVTAAYLRRHLVVLQTLLDGLSGEVTLTSALARLLDAVTGTLRLERPLLDAMDDRGRRRVMDALGEAAGRYRAEVYAGGGLDRVARPSALLTELCVLGRAWLDHALAAARREDGLFDGYDLLRFDDETASVERLYPMLEGQVAVLSSGLLDAAAAAALVERLYEGPLYRPDVDSFLLYPARALPSFLERNLVPEADALAVPLVQAHLAAGDRRLILRDVEGRLRFAPHLKNAGDVATVLRALPASSDDHAAVLALWEATFHHRAFTGRSGTMYAYEGLGSVYWHMIGKLLVAVQEVWRAAEQRGDTSGAARLAALYRRVRGGLGFNRSAEAFGAFPTDPYSHTPAGRGAQQPGMTGLVKEELVARRGELGVWVEDGLVRFEPEAIEPAELLGQATRWIVPDGVRPGRAVEVPAGGLAFLLCGVPVVVQPGPRRAAEVYRKDGVQSFEGAVLDAETSARIFRRDPAILCIVVDRPSVPA